MKRAGDGPNKSYFRTDRFFNAESEWYFATREVADQGPYPTRETAQAELAAFLSWREKAQARIAEG